MPRHGWTLGATVALAFTVAFAPPPAAAQSLWMQRDRDHTVSLEMLHPTLEDLDSELLSGAFFLSGRIAISPGIAIVGELPYANHQSSFLGSDINGFEITVEQSSSTLGNPYVGLEAKIASGPAFVEIGVRPPLASEDQGEAELTGLLTDVARWEAFLPEVVSIQAAFNVREVTASSVVYRLRFSPLLEIPTDGGSADEELYALYSFQIGYHGSAVRVGGGTSGRALLTEDFSNLGERTANQLELHADFLSGSIRPALDLKLPLGELSEFVPVVLGGNLSYTW